MPNTEGSHTGLNVKVMSILLQIPKIYTTEKKKFLPCQGSVYLEGGRRLPPPKKKNYSLPFLIHRREIKIGKVCRTPLALPWRSHWCTFWHFDLASFSFLRHYAFLFWRWCVGGVSVCRSAMVQSKNGIKVAGEDRSATNGK